MTKNIKKIPIIFFGTPEFSVPYFLALNSCEFFDIKLAVTQPDKPHGRSRSKLIPSPIKEEALKSNIKILTPKSLKDSKDKILDFIKTNRIEIGVLVAYGEIIPKEIIDAFDLGIINAHPSLLPKYRGPSPIQSSILNQDKETGITIMKLDDKMDHGPILAQKIFCLEDNTKITAGDLHGILSRLGADFVVETLKKYAVGEITPKPQNELKSTYTKKISKQDGKIDWSKNTQEIEAFIRAMNPWPGAWTIWEGKKITIWKASLKNNNELRINEIQIEGKKRMPFEEFIKGHPDFEIYKKKDTKTQNSNPLIQRVKS